MSKKLPKLYNDTNIYKIIIYDLNIYLNTIFFDNFIKFNFFKNLGHMSKII